MNITWKRNDFVFKAMLMLLYLISSCDSMKSKGLSDGSIQFAGIEHIKFTLDNKYVLTWNPAKSNESILYHLYVQELGAQKSALKISGTPLNAVGKRQALKAVSSAELNPVVHGKLMTTLENSQNSHELNMNFNPDHLYAFMLIAKNVDGSKVDTNNVVVVLNSVTNLDVKGCVEAVALNSKEIRVSVDFPTGSKKVNIFRNNVLVGVVDSPVSTQFIDKDLEVSKDYQYRCEIISGSEVIVGKNQPTLRTIDPFGDYQGCIDAEIENRDIKLNFAFPKEAHEVAIYRGSILVYTSTSPASTSFIDQNLQPGSTHEYSCEVHIDGLAKIGYKKIKARVPDTLATFDGCLEAKALGAADVQIDFQMPSNVDQLKIYRNGVQIYSTSDKKLSSYIDNGLDEGLTYKYTCSAILGDLEKLGEQELTVSTISTNAPVFAGIKNVEKLSPTSVKIFWGVVSSDGVSAATFQIFATPGTLVDWNAVPMKTINAGVVNITLEQLGDQLPYAFGVRACSEQGVCDNNTVMIRLTMNDNGAPKTIGADSVKIENGEFVINAPWYAKDGAILKRKVYLRTGETGGLNKDNYTLAKTVVVTNVANPPVTIKVGGISENQKYHIMVLDEDVLAQLSIPMKFLTMETGDLTPPSFSGIAGISIGSSGFEKTALNVDFNAIEVQSNAFPHGATHYLFYLLSGVGNACKDGVLYEKIAANMFTVNSLNQHTIKKLSEKTLYTVCIKAVDLAGNISNSTSYLSKYTQDKTKPMFDGIQSVSYNTTTAKLDMLWNTSSSSDTIEYKIKMWKNTTNPSAEDITHFVKNANQYKQGFSVAQSEYAFIGNDTIYVLVDACDNAHLIPDGVQNCTTTSVPFQYKVPDVTAPQGFLGIEGSNLIFTPTEGELTVKWKMPEGNNWVDYRGFKIYYIDPTKVPINENSLVFLKDCPCAADNCPNQLMTCDIKNLDAYRTYDLHVRAYDAVGNITTYLNPAVYYTSKRTLDLTAPTFSSNLTATYEQGAVDLAWAMANDNQYALEGDAVLSYLVYRREGSNFSVPTNPTNDLDSLLLETTTSRTFADTAISSNVTYYYTICAVDASNNSTCDGAVRMLTTPDVVPPTILNITSNKEANPNLKVWNLSWELVDNSPKADLRVSIYAIYSDIAIAPTDENSFINFIVSDDGIETKDQLVGITNENKWVHYLIKVQDAAGNQVSAKYSLYSENKVQVTALKHPSGPVSGGKFIIVEGAGFAEGATITIGGIECSNVQYFTTSKMACVSPIHSAGAKTVTVTNPGNTGFHSLANGYTYFEEGSGSLTFCHRSENQGISYVRDSVSYFYPAGDGTSGSPFVICNAAQLDKIRNTLISKKYYVLGENINLASYTNNTFLPITHVGTSSQSGINFNGLGYYVANWTYKVPANSHVAFIGSSGGATMIENLNLVNFDVEGTTYVGLLASYVDRGSCANVVNNVSVHGKVLVHGAHGGGVFGEIRGGGVSNVVAEVEVTADYVGATPTWNIGGFVGVQQVYVCNHTNIQVKGQVSAIDSYSVGGVYGLSFSNVDGCSFQGTVRSKTSKNLSYFGGFAGRAHGLTGTKATIQNCNINANITHDKIGVGYEVGGFVGATHSNVEIRNSTSKGMVTGQTYVGGFVGRLYTLRNPILKNNISESKVVATGNYVGGFIGNIYGDATYTFNFDIQNNMSKGDVKGEAYTGGFVGGGDCQSSRCKKDIAIMKKNRSDSKVESGNDYVGGFAGYFNALPDTVVLAENVATGAVKGKKYVGGFIGGNFATIIDSYSTGDVNADDFGGLFAGWVYSELNVRSSVIKRSYARGKLTKGLGTKFGGFTSSENKATTAAPNWVWEACYWDKQTSAMDSSKGDANQVFGLTTNEMKNKNIFTAAGWDFTPSTGVWKLPTGASSPQLMWEN